MAFLTLIRKVVTDILVFGKLSRIVTPHRCQIITLSNKHRDKLYTTLTLSGIFMPVSVLPLSVFRLTLSGIKSVYAT